jgi:predicted PurR-regulated permease PerM
MTIVTCIGILNTAITKYKTDVKSSDGENIDTKLSKNNKNTVENIKIVFITNVIVTTILGFIISPDTGEEIKYINDIYNSIFNAEFNNKTDAIINKINAAFTWLYSYSWFIMAPVKYVGLLIYWLMQKLFNIIYENKLAAGATYVLASSTYIIIESTRLSRLVIPE